jgi:hypothetical protein
MPTQYYHVGSGRSWRFAVPLSVGRCCILLSAATLPRRRQRLRRLTQQQQQQQQQQQGVGGGRGIRETLAFTGAGGCRTRRRCTERQSRGARRRGRRWRRSLTNDGDEVSPERRLRRRLRTSTASERTAVKPSDREGPGELGSRPGAATAFELEDDRRDRPGRRRS